MDRIVVDPAVLCGKPVIRGTRLTVEFIVDLMAQGWTVEQLIDNYPGLTRADIQACLAYSGKDFGRSNKARLAEAWTNSPPPQPWFDEDTRCW
jgi:uncharacterized protein (DUF433 family)